jgi:hypothetical protein
LHGGIVIFYHGMGEAKTQIIWIDVYDEESAVYADLDVRSLRFEGGQHPATFQLELRTTYANGWAVYGHDHRCFCLAAREPRSDHSGC